MKTALTRIALLLLTIQGVADAQTNDLAPISIRANEKQRILSDPTLKSKAIKNINMEIALLKQQIAELQEIKAELYNNIDSAGPSVDEEKASVVIQSEQEDVESEIDVFLDMQAEADILYNRFQGLYKQAQLMSGKQKGEVLLEYKNTITQYEFKKIEASVLSQKITMIKYNSNRSLIKKLLQTTEHQKAVLRFVKQLEEEAALAIKLANEMREEACAQPNNASKLGAFNNAEEKETIALNKQDEAIILLQKTAQIHVTISVNDLAYN